MAFLKLHEFLGGPVLVNLLNVDRVTKDTNNKSRLWYSFNDSDTLVVHESQEYVEEELMRIKLLIDGVHIE